MKIIKTEAYKRPLHDDVTVINPTCDECNGTFDYVIELGEEPYYESNTARVCIGCINQALALLKKDNH